MAEADFAEQLRRIRLGDAEAAADLVRRFEPALRMEIRIRLFDPTLRRFFDSMDICQSVFKSFFVRSAVGQYQLDRPEQLKQLLVKMTFHKLTHQVRRHRQQKRDVRRTTDQGNAVPEPMDHGSDDPVRRAQGKELLAAVRHQLTGEEWQIAELRGAGCGWPEIAERLGGTPDARRKQFTRAVDRVVVELGLEDTAEMTDLA